MLATDTQKAALAADFCREGFAFVHKHDAADARMVLANHPFREEDAGDYVKFVYDNSQMLTRNVKP